LGIDKRNPFVLSLIHGLRDKNKPITFNELLDIICSRVGETKTKDGLRKLFALYDTDGSGFLDFEKLRAVSKQIHENLNDDEILEMIHTIHVSHNTSVNEGFTFDEFYGVVSRFANK